MFDTYDVTVIGGGIVGCCILFGLAERGITKALLLEKNEFTSASAWHSAGNCTHFGHDAQMTRMYVNPLKTYCRAQAELGQSIGFHKMDSLRFATPCPHKQAVQRCSDAYAAVYGVPKQVSNVA